MIIFKNKDNYNNILLELQKRETVEFTYWTIKSKFFVFILNLVFIEPVLIILCVSLY